MVSVPLRGTTFLNTMAQRLGWSHIRFRPLTGNYISQLILIIIWALRTRFRPLTGNYISQSNEREGMTMKKLFPSPYGELHFSMNLIKFLVLRDGVSVPLRGTTFLNEDGEKFTAATIVSVPLRGTTFLNEEIQMKKFENASFRPLTGNYISQSDETSEEEFDRLFPSPYGELHFSIRPWASNKYLTSFPSPYGELHFSIVRRKPAAGFWRRFRPLTGNYISQWHPLKNIRKAWLLVSVPLRGTTFLNLALLVHGLNF